MFGAPTPVIHIHANNEEAIVKAMLEMGADHWIFGKERMVSGVINPRKVRDQIAAFGQEVPQPTEVNGIDSEQKTGNPHFSVVDDINAAVQRILVTKQDGKKTHFAAVDEMSESVKRIVMKKAASVLALN